MKKGLILLLTVIMLAACSCARTDSRSLFTSEEDVILSADGHALLTAEDFLFAEAYEKASAEFLNSKQPSRDELFIRLAETALCSMFSEEFEVNADREQLNGEYELFTAELSDTDADYKCIAQVKESLQIGDGEFAELFVEHAYMSASAENLVSEIAGVYTAVTDPSAMEEYILINLEEIASVYHIEVNFPDMEDHHFSYASVIS